MEQLTIGRLAKAAGVGIETVRFYERQGLLDTPARTEANYRVYDPREISRLRFIRRAKDLGFTLREIKELFALRQDPSASKADVRKRTQAKIDDINQRIADLDRMRSALEHLVNACDGHGPTSDCPILDALEDKGRM